MNKQDLIAVAERLAGELATVTMTDGTSTTLVIVGKVTTKGLAVRHSAEEPSFYLAPSKIESVEVPTEDTTPEGDAMTTREVAGIFDMSAKELRVITRKLGLGVGKGKRYAFGPSDVAAIRKHLADA